MSRKRTKTKIVSDIYDATVERLKNEPFIPAVMDPKILKILLSLTKEVKKLQNQVMVLERNSYD